MSTSLPTQINEARLLIEQGKYHQAQKILQSVDHPLAEQWLRNLGRFTQVDARKTQPTPELAPDNVIQQVQYGQSLILQRDYQSARDMLDIQPHKIARTWMMTYKLDLHEDLRNTWLDYYVPYIENESLHFKRRSDLLGSKRFAMALDAIYWSEMQRAMTIIETIEFPVQLWWHYWLIHKLKTGTWRYDIRVKMYHTMLKMLEEVGANSRATDTLKQIYQQGKPADPDIHHSSVYEAVHGDGSSIRWVPNSTWSIPLAHLDEDHQPTSPARQNETEEKSTKKSMLRRLIGHFTKS